MTGPHLGSNLQLLNFTSVNAILSTQNVFSVRRDRLLQVKVGTTLTTLNTVRLIPIGIGKVSQNLTATPVQILALNRSLSSLG